MNSNPASSLIHPDFRVWFRVANRGTWKEQPVHAMMIDMRRPRSVGHCVISTGKKIFLKVTTPHALDRAEIRPFKKGSLRRRNDFLRLALSPGESSTLQFAKDPGLCLHVIAKPPHPNKLPSNGSDLITFGPGIHHLPDGVLHLNSNQTLHLEEGAVVKGRVQCEGVENVHICGLGVLDLLHSCPADPQDQDAAKIPGLKVVHSRNVRIEGITIRNPSHYGIMLGQSRGIRINHVSIFTHCLWGDGIDSMACSDLRVEYCFIRTSDDCLAVYADRGEYKGNVSNHRYRHSTLWADVAHPVMIGVHGKQKPPGRILEDLRFENLTILRHCEPSPMYQGCLALNPGDLNTVRKVKFTGIRIEDPAAPRLLDVRILFNPAYNPVPGKAIRQILFENIHYQGNLNIPSVIEGFDRHRLVQNIRIKKLRINGRLQKCLPRLQTNKWAEAPRIT